MTVGYEEHLTYHHVENRLHYIREHNCRFCVRERTQENGEHYSERNMQRNGWHRPRHILYEYVFEFNEDFEEEEDFYNHYPYENANLKNVILKESHPCENDICVICYEPIGSSPIKQVKGCQHNFHDVCMDTWLINHNDCPICRHKI